MYNHKLRDVHVIKGDKLNRDQCHKNDIEEESMKNMFYSTNMYSLIYV